MCLSKSFASLAAPSAVRHPPVLASRWQGKRCESCNLAVGGKEDVRRCTVPSHPRNRQPKPVYAGLGRLGLARYGAIHDRVHSGGEDHGSATDQTRKSAGLVAADRVALHLSMAGRCVGTGPFIVLSSSEKIYLRLLNADAQHYETALPQLFCTNSPQR